jgi:hypothetical protein
MSTYRINFKQLHQRPDFSEMLAALERGFKKFHVDLYLVGAVARDIRMTAINEIPPSRITRTSILPCLLKIRVPMKN